MFKNYKEAYKEVIENYGMHKKAMTIGSVVGVGLAFVLTGGILPAVYYYQFIKECSKEAEKEVLNEELSNVVDNAINNEES